MSNQQTPPPPPPPKDPALASLDAVADLLDNQFRIPGTKFRFGLDSLLGLVPGVGDGLGLLVSGYLMTVMFKKGAGPIIMLRMLGNVLLDALVGIVPFFGDLFDFGFKANRRNVDLLKKYYAAGDAKPRAGGSLAFLMLIFMLGLMAAFWGAWKLSAAVWQWAKIAF